MKKIIPIATILLGAVFTACLVLSFFTYKSLLMTVDNIEDVEQQKQDVIFNSGNEYINQNNKHSGNEIEVKEYKNSTALYSFSNIDFVSYSQNWDTEQLQALSIELFDNVHGEEIKNVDRVIVYGESESNIAGSQEKQNTLLKIPFQVYNFLPENIKIEYPKRGTIISLYRGDDITNIEDMSHVLSHEYGHHFVEHHFGINGTIDDEETEYYSLRSADYEDKIITERISSSHYRQNHMWYLVEIAAEDYVYFMGSKNTKRIVDFYDNQEKLNMYSENELDLEEYAYTYKVARNSTPHENIILPLPHNVEGLQELFYSFVEEEPNEYTITEEVKPDLNIKFAIDGFYHIITWDMPYKSEDVIYTVNLFHESDYHSFVLSTVNGTERAVAKLAGKYDYYLGRKINTIYYAKGNDFLHRIRITITLPDNTVIYSKYLDVKMENSEWFVRHESDDPEQSVWIRNN